MTSCGYDRVTIVTKSDTEEWQAVATVVLLLSQTRTLRNDKQWLRSCYCCHKLGHRGMSSNDYGRGTVVKNTVIRHTWGNDQINSHKYFGLNILYGMHELSLNINPIYWRKSDVNSETKENHLKVLWKVWRWHKWRIL